MVGSDTIKILVSSDNHVGYNERDPQRGDDSWRTFHEVMELAKQEDVDMVLLAGDLFHDNVPSRKAMYQVMRSLRLNCYGDRPCELEILSDASENFDGTFNHVNYEDEDINIAIPVFSIHGNHDDPSGEGHFAALDLLQISGLVNYYGKTPESDRIDVKPVLLQKGGTKLALYGLSNVRDERMHRTFRDHKVKFFQPSVQKENWFNLLSVHQNRYKHTGTDYLPQNFLPDFMNLVIWGHEHECLIDPQQDHETGFHVIQPGSTVATSLIAGEAAHKQVAVLSITGKQFTSRAIPLKTVRPFIARDIILQDEPAMKKVAKRENNRTDITRFLENVVREMIDEAKASWIATQETDEGLSSTQQEMPRPLVRLRVEYTAPEGGRFDCENPQRFSRRFESEVANTNDVIQFHRKKTAVRKTQSGVEVPEEEILSRLTIDSVKVEKLVREYLTAQSLTILPQNSFGDAVSQFVDKDDKHAMEAFVEGSLGDQVKHLLNIGEADAEDLSIALDKHRAQLEELFAGGKSRKFVNRKLKPKPANWDDDIDGNWADQPGAIQFSEREDSSDNNEPNGANITQASRSTSTRGGSRARGARATGSTRKVTPSQTVSKKSSTSKQRGNNSKKAADNGLEDDDLMLIDDDDVANTQRPTGSSSRGAAAVQPSRSSTRTRNPGHSQSATTRQSMLNFSQPTRAPGPFVQDLVRIALSVVTYVN